MNTDPKPKREELEAAQAHLEIAMQNLQTYLGGDGAPDDANLRLAEEYVASAGVLRRRAQRPDRSPEQVTEELQRADWLEKRASVFRAEGRMPAELRTPSETLALV